MLTDLLGWKFPGADLNSAVRLRAGFAAAATLACAVALSAPAAHATVIKDVPPGDFLITFAGPHNADLDVISAEATYDNNNIYLSTTLAGNVGTTANGLYVWGVNRGGGTAALNNQPNPVGAGVEFDAIVVVRPDGSGQVIPLNPDLTPSGPASPLAAGAVTISGNTISAVVPRSFLPGTAGADIEDFGFNIWPRIVGLSSNDQISDFGPDGSTFQASAIPEPASLALMIAGAGLAGALRRRRSPAA